MLFLFFGFFYFLMLILFFAFSYSSFQVIYFVVHNMMHLDSDLFSLSLLSCVLYFFFSFYASSNQLFMSHLLSSFPSSFYSSFPSYFLFIYFIFHLFSNLFFIFFLFSPLFFQELPMIPVVSLSRHLVAVWRV